MLVFLLYPSSRHFIDSHSEVGKSPYSELELAIPLLNLLLSTTRIKGERGTCTSGVIHPLRFFAEFPTKSVRFGLFSASGIIVASIQ